MSVTLRLPAVLLGVAAVLRAAPEPAPAAFFKAYCTQCHGAEKQKGDVRLDDLSKIDPALWKTVFEKLAAEEMPPAEKPQPTAEERRGLLDHALPAAARNLPVAAPGFRRLNQREYGNTVRDLLGLRMGTFNPGAFIYKDEVAGGFDTEARALVISDDLLLEYLHSAEKSLRQALFTSDRDRLPVREVAVDTKTMQGVGGRRYIIPSKEHMIIRNGGSGMIHAPVATRAMAAPGRYTITVTAAGVDRDRYPIRFVPDKGPLVMGFGVKREGDESVTGKGTLQRTFELKDEVDQTFTFDTWIDKDHFPYFSFVNGSDKPITQVRAGIRREEIPASAMQQPYMGPGIRVSAFRITGPFHDTWPPMSYRTTFDSAEIPDLTDTTAREGAVARFAARAFRRLVTREELAPYLRFIEKKHGETGDWHESVIRAFATMMASVDFLYLREEGGELDAHALASRLSYFLWSTMPDAELSALARTGELKAPAVLQTQVARLLADPRADRFADSFADQWLALKNLGTMPPDAKSADYRVYYRERLEPAMREETYRYVRHVLRQNRSVRDFIDSDYSFLNAGLAALYNVPFKGSRNEFARVAFPPEARRGGLMGHASILTLSANGVETSPVERGVWVLKNLLGTPPPPPPKEVPALVPDLNGATTVRELLEKHRNDAACMECHRVIDPAGFALEAYDPIGRFRTAYSKTQAVSTGGEYRGQPFADITGLKKLMLGQTRPFARSLVVRVAEYAKGRKLEASDLKAVEHITDQAARHGYRLKDIVSLIAESDLMKSR